MSTRVTNGVFIAVCIIGMMLAALGYIGSNSRFRDAVGIVSIVACAVMIHEFRFHAK